MKVEIKNRWTLAVQFTAEIPDETAPHLRLGLAVKLAYKSDADLRGADLSGAVLSGAVLSGADLSGAVLSGAVLSGAVLRGAVLRDADLSGAVLRGADLRDAVLRDADLSGAVLRGAVLSVPLATPEEAVANLDKVREIILDNAERLKMSDWHGDSGWKDRTCAEEAVCGTSHCRPGWLQVCSPDPEVRKLEPYIAGVVCAPVASKMFYRENGEVMTWLKDRAYADEAGALT